MHKTKAAIAGILALFAVASASAQQFPTVPDHTVIGRIGVGGQSGPSQAIPFGTLVANIPISGQSNVRSAYTNTGAMATTDCGKTVALGGSAFYAFTIGAASGFNTACQVIIVNEDSNCPANGAATCRGKAVAINGYSAFILWPGQKFTLINQNNVWQYDQPGRWIVQALPQFNVNHASGLNPFAATPLTDCLGSGTGACNTIQNCVLVVEGMIDNNGFGPTCKNVAETFTENNVAHTHPIVGFHVISITGDTTTPGNVVWQVSGTGNIGMQCRDTGMAIVTGFKFVSTGTGNFFINGGQLGVCDFGSNEFGANSGGYDIYVSAGGAANFFGGTTKISGNAAGFILMNGEGHLLYDGATINVSTPVTIGSFVTITGTGFASLTSMTFTGSLVTGSQYLISEGGQASVAGSTIPGTAIGTQFGGGIVYPFVKTNDAAQAGDIGEELETVVLSGSAVALVTATAKTVATLSLTAGDWEVSGTVYFLFPASTSVTQMIASLSATTNTLDATPGKFSGNSVAAFVPGAASSISAILPPYRISLAATTNEFLIGQAAFTASTLSAYGIIRARRMR